MRAGRPCARHSYYWTWCRQLFGKGRIYDLFVAFGWIDVEMIRALNGVANRLDPASTRDTRWDEEWSVIMYRIGWRWRIVHRFRPMVAIDVDAASWWDTIDDDVDPVESSGLSVAEMVAAINASARRRARVADGLESDSSGDTHVEMTEEEEDEMLLKLLPTLFMARAVDKYLADSCWYWYRVQGWKAPACRCRR